MNQESEAALRAVAAHFAATRQDLERIASSLSDSPVPLLGVFAAEARAVLTGRTLDTYRHHIDRLVRDFGTRHLDEITLLELEQVAVQVRQEALRERDARHGFGAQESFVSASRFLFSCAVKAGHLRENPAAGLRRPRRRRSPRRALSADELTAIFDAVLATSHDPELDMLILAFARETACRREGILNARVADIQLAPSVILYEKFDEQREIPISPQLECGLRAHAAARACNCSRIFHYRNGGCLTDRRFDTIFQRIGTYLPWGPLAGRQPPLDPLHHPHRRPHHQRRARRRRVRGTR